MGGVTRNRTVASPLHSPQPDALGRWPDRAVDGRPEVGGDRVDGNLLPEALAEAKGGALRVDFGPIEPPIHHVLDAPSERLEQRERDEVDAATASVGACVTPASSAWSPSRPPANTATRTAVITAHDTVRLMMWSMA